MDSDRLGHLQQALRSRGLDGWLFYDFRQSNPIAYRVLGLSTAQLFTRRWYYWLPADGEPSRLVSALEAGNLDAVPGRKLVYRSRQELAQFLAQMLEGHTTIAMEYSPLAELPVVSRVDAGTVEYLRGLGKTVVSSADLVQAFEAPLSEQGFATHLEAERRLAAIHAATLDYIRDAVSRGHTFTEYDVQQHMLGLYEQHDLFLDHGPDVAVGPNASNPHYAPTAEHSLPLREGDLLLIDWWGKLPEPGAIYADYTWVGVVGTSVPERYREVFDIVRGARDTAIEFIDRHVRSGTALEGWQVDDVARAYITERGYGEYYIHRTGHNLGVDLHGPGANLDNFETHDTRQLLPHTLCSVEPGIYLPEFGIRSEVNVYIGDGKIEVTGRPVQQELPAILR
ncbi:MAG TPA: M24 family metallopeptidase [Chloroflexia bacterium]|jgi:Xaa-Pro aminopeptidase